MIQETTIDQISLIKNSFTLNYMFSRPGEVSVYPIEKEANGENSYPLNLNQEQVEYKEKNENSVYLSYQDLISYLENEYIFENPEEIKRFLMSNKDLIGILFSAVEHIREIFGNMPVYLELHRDPEEDWDELFVVIKTNYPPEKAVELDTNLFENWFVKVLDKVKGRLNFTEEPL